MVREFRSRDGDALRALWSEVDFHSVGDDDASLRRFAARCPGLLLVAAQGERIIASALGGWDGRRGWIYHVATAPSHRRQGHATRLVREVEARLRALGCPRANVLVRLDNPDGARFWEALGYADRSTRQLGRDLDPG
jgi:ribosomal protein S18 acetylase RimI-like enzyme